MRKGPRSDSLAERTQYALGQLWLPVAKQSDVASSLDETASFSHPGMFHQPTEPGFTLRPLPV